MLAFLTNGWKLLSIWPLLTLTLLSLFREIEFTGQTCSMQRVKEKFYLQFMSAHPRMPEFLKMEIVCAHGHDIPLGKKSLINSRFLEIFNFREIGWNLRGRGQTNRQNLVESHCSLVITYYFHEQMAYKHFCTYYIGRQCYPKKIFCRHCIRCHVNHR